MKLSKMKKEDLELLSNKDITYKLIEEGGKPESTADLFRKIIKLLDLPESTFENKIADYYTALSTDKRFVLLSDGKWDLREHHTSDSLKTDDDDLDEEDEEVEEKEENDMEEDTDEDDYSDSDDNPYDDSQEDLKDLVVIDDDDLDSDN